MDIEGTWIRDEDGEIRSYDEDGHLIDNIAIVYSDDLYGDLIAASPDLYEALEGALRAIEAFGVENGGIPQIKAALSKARGEQP